MNTKLCGYVLALAHACELRFAVPGAKEDGKATLVEPAVLAVFFAMALTLGLKFFGHMLVDQFQRSGSSISDSTKP